VVRNDDTTGVVSLICCPTLSGFRKANCQRHYDTHYSDFKEKYPRETGGRKRVIGPLKMKIQQQKLVATPTTLNELSVKYPFLWLIRSLSMEWHLRVERLSKSVLFLQSLFSRKYTGK
jgi:hypothetical protein